MRLHETMKKVWVFLIAFTVLGIISMIPYHTYQKTFNNERQKLRRAPQRHVDAAELYVDAIQESEEDTSKGILFRAPKKYYDEVDRRNASKAAMKNSKKIKRVRIYNDPLYVRDEHDPKVLTPYRKKHVWW